MNYDKLVSTTADVGYLLIASGAEISRAEESMRRIFRAYGIENGEVFALPTFLSVSVGTAEGRPVTAIRRISSRRTDMTRVALANDLCRRICIAKPNLYHVDREVARIGSLPIAPVWLQTAAYALVAFAFTLFYGGNRSDALIALLGGAALRPVCYLLERLRVNTFFIHVSASLVAAVIALSFAHFDPYLNYDKIIIGVLMNLVPGIAITDFMRDIIAGDMISGILRLIESLLVAAAIAIGAGIALTATRMFWGV